MRTRSVKRSGIEHRMSNEICIVHYRLLTDMTLFIVLK